MPTMPTDPEDVRAIALLDEHARRALYEWVVAAGRPVGRDEAAAATGVSRTLAAFHLDRLVAGGLLAPEFRRLSGRTGPGAGRPAKLYRRAPREVAVTLPERRYELAARLLAESVEHSGTKAAPVLRDVARDAGRAMGAAGRPAARGQGRQRSTEGLVGVLRAQGYEPRASEDGVIRMANCPFHALVTEHRDLVCGMNLALAEGIIDGLRDRHHQAHLDPQPGSCCVAFEEVREAPRPRPRGARRAASGAAPTPGR
jgi:predicted ArsR family transcriptional regulator